jgi:hypothetical protein
MRIVLPMHFLQAADSFVRSRSLGEMGFVLLATAQTTRGRALNWLNSDHRRRWLVHYIFDEGIMNIATPA